MQAACRSAGCQSRGLGSRHAKHIIGVGSGLLRALMQQLYSSSDSRPKVLVAIPLRLRRLRSGVWVLWPLWAPEAPGVQGPLAFL